MLHIYYGMGKGKTSCLNGSAIRAKGAGLNVIVYRFLKGRKTNEDPMLKKLGIEVMSLHPSTKFVLEMSEDEKTQTRQKVSETIDHITHSHHKYDMIILDEILDLAASNVNFLNEKSIITLLDIIKDKEVLVTGHTVLPKLFEISDLITEFKMEKHYFEQGIKSREGIEF